MDLQCWNRKQRMKIAKSKFLRDASFNVIASAVASAALLAISVTCARVFGAEQFGWYSYALAVASPVFLLGGMNLRQLLGSYPEAKINASQFNGVQAIGLTSALLIAIVIVAWSNRVSDDTGPLLVALLVVISKLFETAAEGRYGWLVRDGLFRDAAIRKIQRSLISASTFAITSIFVGSLQVALITVAICSGYLLFVHERNSFIRFEFPTKELMALGIISGLSATLDVLSSSLPRVALGHAGSFTEVAHFSAVIQIPAIAAVVVGALGNAAIPRWRTSTKAREAIVGELIWIQVTILGISGALAIIAALIGNQLITLIYGSEFSGLGSLLLLVVLGGAFWFAAGLNGCLLQAKGRYRWQLCSTAVAAVTLVLVLSAILILDGNLNVESAAGCYVAAMSARFVVSSAGVWIWLRSAS